MTSDAASESLLERVFAEAAERADDGDEITTRVLDGAYEQFCRMGIRRSTMEDVARRAGVSRITVYRRFATKDALVEQVVRREFHRYFDQFLRRHPAGRGPRPTVSCWASRARCRPSGATR